MKPQLPSINGLKALSILLVITHHIDIKYGTFDSFYQIPYLKPLLIIITDGQLGVNLFFIISGFLITFLLLQEIEEYTYFSIKKFYIRRVLRIFPAYYAMLGVYAIIQYIGLIDISNASWVTALTYTKYSNWRVDWLTAHAWSLSIEEQFYIIWPLLFLGGKHMAKIVAILFIISVPFVRIYCHFHPDSWIDDMSFFTRIDAIAFGCLFAFYNKNFIHWIKHYGKHIFYGSIILLLSLYLISIFNINNVLYFTIPFGQTHGTFANIALAGIMLYSIFGSKGCWYQFLNTKIMYKIGLLSYSIYLWQQLFLANSIQEINQLPFNLIYLFFASLFSYYAIEKPFLNLKNKF